MKVFVTGAGGFVGAAAVSSALSAGHDVVALVRPNGNRQRLDELGVVVAPVNLADVAELEAAMRHHRPDVIVHSAWSGVSNASRHERLQISDNVSAALSLVDAAAAAGVSKFIGIGSQAEYGLLSGKISETVLPVPTSLYGAAKLAVQVLAAQLCADAGIDFAWLRLFSTYGPRDNPNWLIPSVIEQMLDGRRPMTTEGRQLWDYLFIDDVADAIRAVAESKQAVGIFNLGSGKPIAVRNIIEHIRDIAAPGLDLIFGEIPYKQGQIWHMEADTDRLNKLTGFVPQVELDEGLLRTIEWHKSKRSGEQC
ncbi:NAD-dependent epimerase/dehydratase family protein [Rhizobium sp. RHZ02]|uniref:NAD-dependent epimerase/dehydratase family protein n=1 Tax=Rhizobium sp. RHZ02 TaxID=2769306 RepID=UPI00177E7410|nr:NAD-dependent epimerase/dehydratase family protein [Rhizobium sp. RHZ02]MBD9453525.1 NAD-dependent epimerase/dehydratase family protein [Rhizobium sp. RHZ02]